MAEGQNTGDSLPESQEAKEGLTQNIGGLLDRAGLDRILEPDALFESEQEASEPEPTHPAEDEAEKGDDEEKESSEPSGEENKDSEPESEVLSQSEDDEASEKGQDGLLKRIGKLTAIRKEAEAKASSLEDQVADLRAQLEQKGEESPAVINSNVPYSDVVTVKDVEAKLAEAQEVYDWAEDHPNGTVQGEKDYSEEDVLSIKRRARKALRDLPKRKDYLLRERENSSVVENAFPYWKDRSHPMFQQAMEIVRNRPEIKSHAEWKADVTIYQLGLMAYEELQSSSNQKKPVAKAPAQPTKPTAAKKSVSKEKRAKDNVVNNFTQRRDRDSLTELMKGFI